MNKARNPGIEVMLTTALITKRPGDVIRVKRGYARNYLIPTGRAIRVKGNEAILESKRAEWESNDAKQRKIAHGYLETLKDVELEIKAESGIGNSLYGSVGAGDIAAILERNYGISVPKRDLIMAPIKLLGKYAVKVKLYGGMEIDLPVSVVPTGHA